MSGKSKKSTGNPQTGIEAERRWPMRCAYPAELHGRTNRRSAAGVERRSPADSRGRGFSWSSVVPGPSYRSGANW